MRIEQNENNMYSKYPDRIDAYLIRVINRFFDSTMENIEKSRDSIIMEAVNRMKADLLGLSSNGIAVPVTSVNSKTGIVVLEPEDIGAEPAFTKNTAFNKNFGKIAGTVTEGNDPRLSDARTPKEHQHDSGDINGLGEAIENNGKVQDIDKVKHSHPNKEILDKIIYSGAKAKVDLADIEKVLAIGDTGTSMAEHIINGDIHVFKEEKEAWTAKETPDGAQNKADAAEQNAKDYTDTKLGEIKGNPPEELNTLEKLAEALGAGTLANKVQSLESNLQTHTEDSDIHITPEERENWNKAFDDIGNVADHNHDELYYGKTSIDDKFSDIQAFLNMYTDHTDNLEVHVSEDDRINWSGRRWEILLSGDVIVNAAAGEVTSTATVQHNLTEQPFAICYQVMGDGSLGLLPTLNVSSSGTNALGIDCICRCLTTPTDLIIKVDRASTRNMAETFNFKYFLFKEKEVVNSEA